MNRDSTIEVIHIDTRTDPDSPDSPDWDRTMGQILVDPDLLAQIWADAEIDLTLEAAERKLWWVAVENGRVLAFCAAWMATDDCGWGWYCGNNYEMPGRARDIDAYLEVFAARQEWIERYPRSAVTYLFGDGGPLGQAIDPHLDAGWKCTGVNGGGELDGHHWWQLVWNPQ